MANPRKFSEKIALHNQKQAEETAAFEKIMREVSDATNKVSSGSRRARFRPPPEPPSDDTLRPGSQSLGTFRSGSLPNVAAAQTPKPEPEIDEPEEATLAAQYGIGGNRMGSTSPSRNTGQRGRSSTSVGPMRRPSERKHDTSPYGSTVYLSPPPDSSWRRTNSDSALHQSCAGGVVDMPQTAPALSPHHHMHPHQNHRRADIHLNALSALGANANRPRSSCEMPRIPNNNVYDVSGGGGLVCGELQVPGGSLPDLTSVHCPPPHGYHRASPASPDLYHHQSPHSGGGASPASGSPVGAGHVPEPSLDLHSALNDSALYDTHNHLSVPNTNNYLHHNKSMSPLEHSWITSSYQSHCSPPSQYSSTSNINVPSPTMVHSPGSPVESPQTDYNNIHQTLLQPFEQITMLDSPASNNYNAPYMNHSSPHSPQTTNSPLSYCQQTAQRSSNNAMSSMSPVNCQTSRDCRSSPRTRDPVPGGVYPALSSPAIPDIILTDYSGELDAGLFGGEEAQLRAGLDLDELTLLEEPSALLPDSSVEHEFRLDRL